MAPCGAAGNEMHRIAGSLWYLPVGGADDVYAPSPPHNLAGIAHALYCRAHAHAGCLAALTACFSTRQQTAVAKLACMHDQACRWTSRAEVRMTATQMDEDRHRLSYLRCLLPTQLPVSLAYLSIASNRAYSLARDCCTSLIGELDGATSAKLPCALRLATTDAFLYLRNQVVHWATGTAGEEKCSGWRMSKRSAHPGVSAPVAVEYLSNVTACAFICL